jgi:hypothetical protein
LTLLRIDQSVERRGGLGLNQARSGVAEMTRVDPSPAPWVS